MPITLEEKSTGQPQVRKLYGSTFGSKGLGTFSRLRWFQRIRPEHRNLDPGHPGCALEEP